MMAQETVAKDLAVEIRLARPADRQAIVEMYEVFEPKGACLGLPPRKDPGRWLNTLSEFPNFIALQSSKVIAHAALCPDGEIGEVAVFVHQDFRSCGLGRQLLEALIREARRMGLRRVWGMTELDNVPMLRLARSLGFVTAEDPREFFLELSLN
jgi:GNAT superfamily N-acetyltransferase